ncbi:MAG: phosphatidate cytidylyltransferase [Methylococcaceae bacterium]|nr:phosphatidate cytidylyltransferase [Methylococcaceae bacterium]
MLKNRVITALVLAPLIVAGILLLPPMWYAVVWGLVFAVATWEWSGLCGLEKVPERAGLVLVMSGLMITGPQWADYVLDWLSWPVVAWWFILSLLFRRMPGKLLQLRYPLAVKILVGVLVLITSWIHLVWLRVNFGANQVLYLLLLIWAADISAYFAGKRWGLTKLTPEISPGKTAEGLYGALFASMLFAAAVALYNGMTVVSGLDFVLLSVVTVVISVVGDLFESLVKRIRGVKDSGAILPGHGGLLDRIDSVLAAAPVFYLGSFILEIFL